jgi:hypothetical protein
MVLPGSSTVNLMLAVQREIRPIMPLITATRDNVAAFRSRKKYFVFFIAAPAGNR